MLCLPFAICVGPEKMNLIFSKVDRIDVDRKFIVCLNVLKDDKGKKVWSGEYVVPCVCVCVCAVIACFSPNYNLHGSPL